MPKHLWIVIAVLVAAVAAPSVRADSSYNLVTGFSSASNPNGVWTYEYNGTVFSGAQGFSNVNGTGLPGWWTNEAIPNSMVIAQNVTGSTFVSSTLAAPTNNLWMDPESGSISVMFTAPSAGTYTIDGNFLGIDMTGNSHPVSILDDGTVVWSGTIATYGADDSFDFVETLNAGDTISFDVGTGSTGCTYCFLSTGLNGTITESGVAATPEPGTVGLTIIGLGFMLVLVKRRPVAQGSQQAA